MAYTGLDQTERVQAGSTSFVYDLFGISQRAASSGTFYELRDNTGQLLSERGTSGTSYVLFDALGSTTGLTDASGNLVSTWTYDPWGNVLSQSGVVATPFLFGGTYLDQATGLYKMGARYYDPSIGRWTQPDAILGTVEHPTTLNRYLYANADPVDLSDPSGYWCNWFLVAVGVAEIIHGLAALWWGGAIAWWVYGIVAAASWNIILALMIATFVLATVPWWAGGMLIVWTGYYHIRHSGCF
jgi:RHS repeat-associated protein